MGQKPLLNTAIPGPKSESLRKKEESYLAPGLQGFAQMAGIVVDHANGSWITDIDGNKFLDFIGGIGVNGLGHSHPVWVKKIQSQVEKVSIGSFTSENRVQLLEKISQHAPQGKDYVTQLYSSGAEAVESALRLAKNVTGKYEAVSFWGGFHGKTQGVLSLMGSDFKKTFGPFAPGSCVVPYPDSDRPPFLVPKGQSFTEACIAFAEKQVAMNLSGQVAAILVEPIQGTAGNVIPPDDFLLELKKLAEKWNALLICDEMITGFGRSGKWWGCEHSGVTPDIITIGKQFGGGFPISGVMLRSEISNAKPWGEPSGSSSSYGGNPLASAAALAAIEVIEEENLVTHSQQMGNYFLEKLKTLEKNPFISKIRGRGLMIGIDLVDPETQAPLSKEKCKKIFDQCLQKGLLTMAYANRFRIQTAMTIQKEEIDCGVGILEDVFEQLLVN